MLGYTLGQMRGYLDAVDAIERERLRLDAVAVRAGGAQARDWYRWLQSLDPEGR